MNSGADLPTLNEIRSSLPELPGVYKYIDTGNKIIYIGKARNLRRRVNSYFTKQHADNKTRMLLSQIAAIEYVVTHDEKEALVLENNLIKQHQPKYNLLLRDGKSYPYVCISNERFPRVFATRQKIKDGSRYYGPFPSVGTMYSILDFIYQNFKLRNCNYVLSDANIKAGKFKPCLEYQIGNCAAPCVGNQSQELYDEDIRQIRQLLRGNFKPLIEQLKIQMQQAAEVLAFERAQYLKKRLEQIQQYKRKNTIVSETMADVEVFTIVSAEGVSVVNHFKVSNGAVIETHTYDSRPKNEETEADILAAAVWQLLAENESEPAPTILTNLPITDPDLLQQFDFQIPTRGDELKIIELSIKNCEVVLNEKNNRTYQDPTERLLKQLQKDLRLPQLPVHIECFDNSNIQGYAPVSSCVVFKNGKPSKKDYRVYNVQTVQGPDDFATMRETVMRRYKKMIENNEKLPDLIVIDGGKGQLSHALEALTLLGIEEKVAVVSIAKRLEEIYFKNDPVPLYIDKKSASLALLQRLRNEAHNTAIAYHRKKRDEKTIKTTLTELPGIGPVLSKKLLKAFGSVKQIKTATLEALREVIGKSRAEKLLQQLQQASAGGDTIEQTAQTNPKVNQPATGV